MKTGIKSRILTIAIVVALICTISPFSLSEVDAASYTTKASVEKRIKTVNSEIAKLNKTYKAQKSKQDQQKKGTTYLLGSVESYDPFIMCQMFTGSYYWVTNPSSLSNSILLASGYVKKTGEYRTYNGRTCVVVKAVYVSNAADTTKKKLDSKKKELAKLKKALTDTPKINQTANQLIVGDSYTLTAKMKGSTGTYNKLTWSTSNKKVCTVQNGKITGIAPGTCSIKVTSSVSKKTAVLKVKVVGAKDKLKLEYDSTELTAGKVYPVRVKCDIQKLLYKGNYIKKVEWKSSDTSVAVIENDYYSESSKLKNIKALAPGTVDITCTVNGKHVIKQTFEVKEPENTGDEGENTGNEGENTGDEGENTGDVGGETNSQITPELTHINTECYDEISLYVDVSDRSMELGCQVLTEDGYVDTEESLEAWIHEDDDGEYILRIDVYVEEGNYIVKVFDKNNPSNYANIYVDVIY